MRLIHAWNRAWRSLNTAQRLYLTVHVADDPSHRRTPGDPGPTSHERQLRLVLEPRADYTVEFAVRCGLDGIPLAILSCEASATGIVFDADMPHGAGTVFGIRAEKPFACPDGVREVGSISVACSSDCVRSSSSEQVTVVLRLTHAGQTGSVDIATDWSAQALGLAAELFTLPAHEAPPRCLWEDVLRCCKEAGDSAGLRVLAQYDAGELGLPRHPEARSEAIRVLAGIGSTFFGSGVSDRADSPQPDAHSGAVGAARPGVEGTPEAPPRSPARAPELARKSAPTEREEADIQDDDPPGGLSWDIPGFIADEIQQLRRGRAHLIQVTTIAPNTALVRVKVLGVCVRIEVGQDTYPDRAPILTVEGDELCHELIGVDGTISGLRCQRRWNRTLTLAHIVRELELAWDDTPPRPRVWLSSLLAAARRFARRLRLR